MGRGALLALGAPVSMGVLVGLERCVCPCTRELLSVPARGQEGAGLSVLVWCVRPSGEVCECTAAGTSLSVGRDPRHTSSGCEVVVLS